MIKRKPLKTKPVCNITFEIHDEAEADRAELIGDFTDWKPVEFTQLKDGRWKFQTKLDKGQDYQFRYRILRDGEIHYRNDEQADRYEANEFGTDNSVISI